MRKPQGWYGFSQVKCGLYEGAQSNMSPRSAQHYCHRRDRQSRVRPYWEGEEHFPLLKCHWNVCPKLKEQRKSATFKGWDAFGNEIV